MTDLINRINELDEETLNKLFKKYEFVLPEIKHGKNIPHLLYIINLSVNYIQANYKEEPKKWKTWAVVLIKRLFEQGKITTKKEIFKNIDLFFKHKNSEYKKYASNIGIYSDEYYKDNPFLIKYIKNL